MRSVCMPTSSSDIIGGNYQGGRKGHARQPIANRLLRRTAKRLVPLERAGQWGSDEAVELDQELVELERLLPDDFVHEE